MVRQQGATDSADRTSREHSAGASALLNDDRLLLHVLRLLLVLGRRAAG
jgi:hypothetical protein